MRNDWKTDSRFLLLDIMSFHGGHKHRDYELLDDRGTARLNYGFVVADFAPSVCKSAAAAAAAVNIVQHTTVCAISAETLE